MTLDLKRSHCGTVAVSPDGVMIQPRLWCSPEKYVWVLPMFVLGNSKLVVVLLPHPPLLPHTHSPSIYLLLCVVVLLHLFYTTVDGAP